MNAAKNLSVALAVVVGCLCSAKAEAAKPKGFKPRISTTSIPPTCDPRVGFAGTMVPGVGMRVDQVFRQIGLNPGDIVVKINGQVIHNQRDYDEALTCPRSLVFLAVVSNNGVPYSAMCLKDESRPIAFREP